MWLKNLGKYFGSFSKEVGELYEVGVWKEWR